MGDNATLFNKVLGVLTLVLGVAGFVPAVAGLVTLEAYDNYAHLVLGVVALGIAFKASEDINSTFAKVAGVIAIIFGVWGFVSPGSLGVSFTMLENILHLALGIWGAWAGFSE